MARGSRVSDEFEVGVRRDATFRGNGSALVLKRDREDGHLRSSVVLRKEGIEAVCYGLRYATGRHRV
jgi:hypothetical protein